ncbi:putative AlkP superfamily pyrophosphatase or phosphodiesterase [Flavobacteriaceae bacterium MAR_2010_72]|nr:putative AlkP superfamily pyrophosphatase or phosphodiesterase [Flavobacteriaceae bacterium MAR_2010_72]
MKHFLVLVWVFLISASSFAQFEITQIETYDEYVMESKPKLVVGIVIDQMRYDYLTRFYSRYGEGGFKRMIKEGFNCKNNQINYIPTKTGPGHASIFTGITPKYHGIIGNDWFDKELGQNVYCVGDNTYNTIGASNRSGKISPHRMLTNSFADENRLATQMRGKSIGISIKERGAVLPVGHTANAAYWLDYENNGSGNWVTSSFYMDKLPQWVLDFNASKITESYFKEWTTLYDLDSYSQSGNDLNTFEGGFNGKETATFPYDLNALKSFNGNYNIIAETPFGNSLTTDFALEAIKAEQLGQDEITDVLTISYSSTDKVGHNFGVNSKEIEDTYLRMDLELERLLKYLDANIGRDKYTVFLTADHAAPDVPSYLKSLKIPADYFDESKMYDHLNDFLQKKYGVANLVLSRINNQIFLDHSKIKTSQLDLQQIKKELANELLTYDLIDKVYLTSNINQLEATNGYLEELLKNGHHQKRSGDVLFVYTPNVFKDTPWNRTGTDHHSGFNYDTHIPLLFFGKGIKHGSTLKKTNITDIAPTISALLGISFPNGATGQPLEFVLH